MMAELPPAYCGGCAVKIAFSKGIFAIGQLHCGAAQVMLHFMLVLGFDVSALVCEFVWLLFVSPWSMRASWTSPCRVEGVGGDVLLLRSAMAVVVLFSGQMWGSSTADSVAAAMTA